VSESKRLAKKIIAKLFHDLPGFDSLWENTSGEVQRDIAKRLEEMLDDTVAPGSDKP
jgi:hypothetical protein